MEQRLYYAHPNMEIKNKHYHHMETKEYRYVVTKFAEHEIYTFAMRVGDLLQLQYVASRGVSTEQGAVQRILNKGRVDSICSFVLNGNSFVNTFILNWTETKYTPKIKKETLVLPLQGRFAQMLDGQHRIAGLLEATNHKQEVADMEVLVSLFIGLNTKEAARIFLNINSEQKPVPRSLIYDLFGEAYDDPESAITRVTDIVAFLNETKDSPYYGHVHYPGKPNSQNLIDLAIMVNAMKPAFERNGTFNQLQLSEIETQQKIILNFFTAIKNRYADVWDKPKENIFLRAAGFSGAFDFLTGTLLQHCQTDRKFSVSHMEYLMKLDSLPLLKPDDVKSLGGRTAKSRVTDYFRENYLADLPEDNACYEF